MRVLAYFCSHSISPSPSVAAAPPDVAEVGQHSHVCQYYELFKIFTIIDSGGDRRIDEAVGCSALSS